MDFQLSEQQKMIKNMISEFAKNEIAPKAAEIDEILQYRDMPMNNFWAYVMNSGYVVPFIDNAGIEPTSANIYGTSLGYDETCEKLICIRRLFSEIGFEL